jgi:hypothetical protein
MSTYLWTYLDEEVRNRRIMDRDSRSRSPKRAKPLGLPALKDERAELLDERRLLAGELQARDSRILEVEAELVEGTAELQVSQKRADDLRGRIKKINVELDISSSSEQEPRRKRRNVREAHGAGKGEASSSSLEAMSSLERARLRLCYCYCAHTDCKQGPDCFCTHTDDEGESIEASKSETIINKTATEASPSLGSLGLFAEESKNMISKAEYLRDTMSKDLRDKITKDLRDWADKLKKARKGEETIHSPLEAAVEASSSKGKGNSNCSSDDIRWCRGVWVYEDDEGFEMRQDGAKGRYTLTPDVTCGKGDMGPLVTDKWFPVLVSDLRAKGKGAYL